MSVKSVENKTLSAKTPEHEVIVRYRIMMSKRLLRRFIFTMISPAMNERLPMNLPHGKFPDSSLEVHTLCRFLVKEPSIPVRSDT